VERPPTSGPGSGVTAWRAYAAAVTDSPVESWSEMSREEIIELLDADGVEQAPAGEAEQAPAEADADQADAELAPARPRRPVWMVPTPDGMVPESELRRR
jgi:hypothetical protein